MVFDNVSMNIEMSTTLRGHRGLQRVPTGEQQKRKKKNSQERRFQREMQTGRVAAHANATLRRDNAQDVK